jgi:hypothetical protein
MWGALSDERTGLLFTIAAGPRQRSHSRVRVPRDCFRFETRKAGGPVTVFISPQEQRGAQAVA